MKKILGILLATLIVGSMFSYVSIIPFAFAQPAEWPEKDVNGDGEINLDDTLEYVKSHYVSYDSETGTYQWDFEDPYDIAMADYFMQSVLYVEYIRDSNDDKSVFELANKLLSMPGFENGLDLKNFDDTDITIDDVQSFVYFQVKNFLTNSELLTQVFDGLFQSEEIIELLTKAGLTIEEIGTFKETLVIFLVEEGEEWLLLLEQQVDWVTLRTIDSAMSEYPIIREVSDFFTVAITIYDLINIAAEHTMNIIEIGISDIMESVKLYEIWQVEIVRLILELVGKIAMVVGEQIIQPHFIHGLVTVCAALATFGGPPGIVAAAMVGVAGIVFYFTVKDILETAWDWAADETLGLDLAIHKKLAKPPNSVYIPLYEIRVTGINTQDKDNYIPWGPGFTGEDVYVEVRNVGLRTLNLRVEPEIISIDPDTGKTGWNIDDKQWEIPPDNWIEKENLTPGEYVQTDFCFHVESGTIEHHFPWPFSSINDKWIPGENPAAISFKFHHDWLTDWWDIFDIIGGLKYLDSELAFFYNSVDILIAVQDGLDPTNGETVQRVIDVKNLKTEEIGFFPEVRLIDPLNEIEKYDSQIRISPSGEISVKPQQVSSFTIEWTAPEDAPTGFYSIIVNAKDQAGKRYTDNLGHKAIFFLYKLKIIFPKNSSPARAGNPENPNTIFVFTTGLPPLAEDPTFTVKIGNKPVSDCEIVDTLPVPAGYTLRVLPPTQELGEGKYALEVTATFKRVWWYSSSALETDAVEYRPVLPAEPIEKGLAWLRTRQYGDGSWRSSVGVTALCVLAFLNAGFDESDPTVQKAIQYLLLNVRSDGSIYRSSQTYETSMALIALVATYNSDYQPTIDAAKDWLVSSQWDESCLWGSVNKYSWYYGGFGYGGHSRPDLSNTQFAALALDAAGLPKEDPTWTKLQVFLHRCQKVNFPITLTIDGAEYTVQPWNYAGTPGGYDGGFVYTPGNNPYGAEYSMGSMTGAGIWGLLLSGVSKSDLRVTKAINWVADHYTWETNYGCYGYRRYYTYLSLAKALTMYGKDLIDEHDWYQDLYNKITSPSEMITVGTDQAYWSPSKEDYVPDLSTAYAILSLQTRAAAPPVQRLSYLTFILGSNCFVRILDAEGNVVGYNYMTGLGENQIPTAVYSGSFSELQYIVIVNPEAGTYKLELVGVSEGPYGLIIQGNYGEEVTDDFTYLGHIRPAELLGSEVTVTAIVGPIDVYATPPKFEKIVDNIPPETKLEIGEPKYVDPMDNTYVSSDTSFMLMAEDNPGGMGVASTFYRIYNSTYDMGWLEYSVPFHLTDLSDAEYSIDYYSTDNIGNRETTDTATVTLDNTGPLITIVNPPAGWALQDGVTFIASAVDPCGVASLNFSIREANDGEGVPIGFEDLPVSYDEGTGEWSFYFDTLLVPDGYYVLYIEAEDNLGNKASTTVPYSIRNWAVIELLPSSENNKAGRTMPVKFALRVAAAVDPLQPFVYNEELTIDIYATNKPDDILQESTYGDTARDYRISSVLYITNFKTLKKPMEYTVTVYRHTLDIDSFTFETVK